MLNEVWRIGFRLLYNELAFTYDVVSRAVSLGHWRSWQRCVLPFLPSIQNGLVLELAHGTGDLQIDLLRAGYRTVALDISPAMGRLARRKLQRTGFSAGFVRGNAVRLPYRSNSLASVVCTFPTPFIFNPQALKELARVIEPSGKIIIVLVGQLHGGGLIRGLIRRLYLLTGQHDEILSDSAVRDLFRLSEFNVKSRVVTLDGSAAQLAILAKVAKRGELCHDIRLDLAQRW